MSDHPSLIERAAQRLARQRDEDPPRSAPAMAEPGTRDRRAISVNPAVLKARGFISADQCDSRLAEEVRLAKRRLLRQLRPQAASPAASVLAANDGALRGVVVVSSACPGEGKSTFALNLALSVALDEKMDVALVDADLLHPRLFEMVGLERTSGMTDALRDPDIDPAALLCRDAELGLSFMDAGSQTRTTAEQFAPAKVRSFVEKLVRSCRNGLVIIDTAPLLMHTSALTLAQLAEQVVFVIEANRTEQSKVQAALDLLDGASNVNLLLNKVSRAHSAETFSEAYCYY